MWMEALLYCPRGWLISGVACTCSHKFDTYLGLSAYSCQRIAIYLLCIIVRWHTVTLDSTVIKNKFWWLLCVICMYWTASHLYSWYVIMSSCMLMVFICNAYYSYTIKWFCCVLLYFGVICSGRFTWCNYPYSSGMIASVPVMDLGKIYLCICIYNKTKSSGYHVRVSKDIPYLKLE